MIFDLAGGELPEAQELWMPELPAELEGELFALAHAVREREPWKEFLEQDWYGVRDPGTGEVGIVSIAGADGKVFAIQLYLPPEGIRFWNELAETGGGSRHAVRFDLRMIRCEFCDEEGLPEEDRMANEMNPPQGARKRKAGFVSFRSHRPEYFPWFIDESEGRMIANALRLLPAFCEFTGDAGLHPREGRPPIPVFSLKADGDPRLLADWEGRVELFPVAEPKQVPPVPRDEVFEARMGALSPKEGTTWEIGSFYLPGPAQLGDRLVYPTLTVTAPHELAELPMPLVGSPEDGLVNLLRKSFAAMAEQQGYLPAVLIVGSQLAENTFRDLAESSGMRIDRVEELPNLGRAMEQMIASSVEDLSSEMEGLFEDDPEEPTGPADYREPTSTARYVMRIDLMGAKPPIWRRISLPVDASFFDLHVAIQDAMGWEGYHLHSFEIRQGMRPVARIEWPSGEDDFMSLGYGPDPLCEVATTLREIVESGHRKIHYCYDFGDDWQHRIQIEKTVESELANPLPELLKGRGACPPEDCGGIWGYHALLEGDPDFTEGWDTRELKRLREAEFDPKAVVFTPARKVYDQFTIMRGG